MPLQMIIVNDEVPFCVDPSAIVAIETEVTMFVGTTAIKRFGEAPAERMQLSIRLRCGHTIRTGHMDVDAAARMMDGLHQAANGQGDADQLGGQHQASSLPV